MNDFTLDELCTLFKCVRLTELARGEHPDLDNVYLKLQVKIDNYCEHEPHGDFHVCVDKCKKCGVIVDV